MMLQMIGALAVLLATSAMAFGASSRFELLQLGQGKIGNSSLVTFRALLFDYQSKKLFDCHATYDTVASHNKKVEGKCNNSVYTHPFDTGASIETVQANPPVWQAGVPGWWQVDQDKGTLQFCAFSTALGCVVIPHD